LPEFNKPVLFSSKCNMQWKAYWAAMPGEKATGLLGTFAASERATADDMAGWDWEATEHSFACHSPWLPGWAFLAVEHDGHVQVLQWCRTEGDATKGLPKMKRKYVTPPPPKPKANPPEAKADQVIPAMGFDPVPAGLSLDERIEWTEREWKAATRMMVGLPGDNPLRQTLTERQSAMREANLAAKRERNDIESDGESEFIRYRPDGSHASTVPVIRYLLRKVAELETRITVNGG